MLPKTQRLNLKTDFKWVASGKPLDTKFAKLFIRTGDNISPRVGIATSSKTFKEAVDRNRARRLISAAFEIIYKELPSSINIVALPKVGILSVKSGDVLVDLQDRLKDAKISS
jgi:ribonuclease P protein component